MSAAADNEKISLDAPNPCWEDIYDDDCVMSNAASASFKAADWIKKMPCWEGHEVRAAMSILMKLASLSGRGWVHVDLIVRSFCSLLYRTVICQKY